MTKPPRGLKQDWSRQLPVPIKVGRRMLRSLDDIRRHQPSLSEHQQGSYCMTANGKLADIAAATNRLERVLHDEGC